MDVIALAQAGIAHAVAPLGTAITEAQLAALWKAAPEPVVALDGDAAGLAAAQRLIDLALPLLGPERALRFALLPAGQDPDDVVRSGGAAAMQAILDELAADGRAPLGSRDRRPAARQPRAPRRPRRPPAGASREDRRRRPARPLGARDPRRAAPRCSSSRAPPGRRAALGAREGRLRRPAGWRRCRQPRARCWSATPRGRPRPACARARSSPDASTTPTWRWRCEDRLERLAFRCPDLGAIRDALVAALATVGPGDGEALRAAVAARLGHDPLPALAGLRAGARQPPPPRRTRTPSLPPGRSTRS